MINKKEQLTADSRGTELVRARGSRQEAASCKEQSPVQSEWANNKQERSKQTSGLMAAAGSQAPH